MNNLEKQIKEILKAEVGIVKESTKKIAREIAEETVKKLKSTAPRRSGKYRNSFKIKETGSMSFVVHSEKHYRLTHLLEFGHDIIKNGVREGRSKAKPHWAKAEEEGIKKFEKRVKEEIERG